MAGSHLPRWRKLTLCPCPYIMLLFLIDIKVKDLNKIYYELLVILGCFHSTIFLYITGKNKSIIKIF